MLKNLEVQERELDSLPADLVNIPEKVLEPHSVSHQMCVIFTIASPDCNPLLFEKYGDTSSVLVVLEEQVAPEVAPVNGQLSESPLPPP